MDAMKVFAAADDHDAFCIQCQLAVSSQGHITNSHSEVKDQIVGVASGIYSCPQALMYVFTGYNAYHRGAAVGCCKEHTAQCCIVLLI